MRQHDSHIVGATCIPRQHGEPPRFVSGAHAINGWQLAWAQLEGTTHSCNEDTVGYRVIHAASASDNGQDDTWLAVSLSDGVGRGSRADVASRATVGYCLAIPPDALANEESIKAYMLDADSHVRDVLKQATDKPGAAMLAAAWVHLRSGQAYATRVGDSRLYRLDSDSAHPHQLMPDQSYAYLGERPPPDHSPLEPARMVGTGVMGYPEIEHISVQYNETLLLCSDGLYWGLSECDFDLRALKENPRITCGRMALRARKSGSNDDISVLTLRRTKEMGGM